MTEAPATVVAEDPVEAALARFLEGVRLAHERFDTTVARDLLGAIGDSVRTAAVVHQRLLGDLAARDSGTSPQPSAWCVVHAYRQATVDAVHRPVRDALDRLDAGSALASALQALADDLEAAAADVPERLLRPEPPQTWMRTTGDSGFRSAGKALVRGRRRARAVVRASANRLRSLIGRAPRPGADPVQDVPLQRLAAYHVAVRCADARAAFAAEYYARLGRIVGGLEVAFSDWLHEVLALESTLDSPLEHLPAAAAVGVGPASSPPAVADLGLVLADALRAAERLRTALESAADAVEEPAEGGRAGRLAADAAALTDDVVRIGTFMLPESRRAPRSREIPDTGKTAADWTGWLRQAVVRLQHDVATADLRDSLARSHEALVASLHREAVDPLDRRITATAEALEELRLSVERSCTEARAAGDSSALRGRLQAIEGSAHEIVLRELLDPVSFPAIEAASRNAAESCVNGVLEAIARLSASATVHEPALPGRDLRPTAARTVRIRARELAAQAFDVVLLEKIRTSIEPAIAAFAALPEEGNRIEDVIRFNLQAALDEIQTEDAGPAKLDGAEELALNGLDRSIGIVRTMRDRVRTGADQAGRTAWDAFGTGWNRFHGRIRVEDRVQEQLLDIRYRIGATLREVAGRLRDALDRLAKRALEAVGRGRARVLRLLRLGQAVVEGERISLEQQRATAEAVAALESLMAGLPLVYRRLFAFQPVSDPALLVGRDGDLEVIRQHHANWKVGITDALILSGGHGSGRTSLLGAAREAVLGEMDVHVIDLRERILDERAFIEALAPGLPPELRTLATFHALIDGLLESDAASKPRAIIVEGLEHTLFRTASGNGLLGRVFSLMSATDSKLFWLGSISRPAWDYIERTEPMSPRLVRHYALSSLGRNDLERLMMVRHLRSGLPIEFGEAEAPNVALRRRLGRAGTEADRQAVLRTEFFDRLHRATGPNVTLALFYWLRSAAIDGDAGVLRVRELQPLNFGQLESLSLAQCFALKAFLDHGSLTLEEYGRILAAPTDETREMFESLGNLLLIEPADHATALSDFRAGTISDGQRYCVRPLFVHPVTRHLHGKNLLLSPV